MARKDQKGQEIIIGDRLHIYTSDEDYGTGTVVPGKGKALMIFMDPGCKLEGKHNLRDLDANGISMIIIGRKPQAQETLEEDITFTKEDLDNLNYLLARGITGSIKRTAGQYTITISISKP